MALLLAPALVLAAALLWPAAARAQIGSDRYSSIVIDAASGRVLEAVAADAPRYPASLTKMMTLYLLFEALRDRRLSLDSPVPVSGYAAATPPSRLGLVPGVPVTVEDLLLGLITKSANDAAAALAEMIGGSEDRFAEMMTLRARGLGMASTTFRNASGLPDPQQITTARDMAVLARHLVQDFPEQYRYFSTPGFLFRGRLIRNHDHMLTTYPGADGIKTGYTVAAGHNLVTSAVREGVRLIGVVMGAASNPERDAHMANLLDQGFGGMNVTVIVRNEAPFVVGIPRLVSAAHAQPIPAQPVRLRPPDPPRHAAASAALLWGVQVGSFGTSEAARRASAEAHREAAGGEVHVEQIAFRHHPAWRAELVGLTGAQARNACASLARHRIACLVLRPGPGNLASR